MYTEIIGWLSSLTLVLTIGKQIHAQWKKGTSKGVSPYLFLGQMAASTGFLVYSVLLKSWVFIVTNGLMLLSAMIGLALVMVHRRRARGRSASHGPADVILDKVEEIAAGPTEAAGSAKAY
jgi:uncharacterized protein with PQ loop repeat